MANPDLLVLRPDWEFVSDRVMGGVSDGEVRVDGMQVARLKGHVSLDNNGGFVQMAFDLRADGTAFDASGWTGVQIRVRGNGQTYEMRLRTDQLSRPWQSYTLAFDALAEWRSIQLPFAHFMPHRTEVMFDPAKLRRIGILAVGREFDADLSVSEVALYR